MFSSDPNAVFEKSRLLIPFLVGWDPVPVYKQPDSEAKYVSLKLFVNIYRYKNKNIAACIYYTFSYGRILKLKWKPATDSWEILNTRPDGEAF